ncbi:Spy/CpxP family protein refolding chaperone [Mariniflexile maritimum]|jgi:Spy/CpxP family protein refolding chaperone|uniref:Spy/CpxP family protein refolding chaperone n=1 Tax=Mariniflexile maritimum TaxID=2682493 RepID=UPI0012F6CFC1|nr:periplasmic heavy metal sensor [Mariniflexile maritimum]HMQ44384.1 periplasmic heavy metal sensor [Mariniflexile sp.]HMR16434.1 periplasmic heavy metal sensor [Mariniflexile sp.]
MQKNIKILLGIIGLLVLLNLSIVGTILYRKNEITNYKSQNNNEKASPTKHLGRYFKEALNLSNQQQRAFQEIRQRYHQNSDILLEKMDKNRNDIVTELGKPASDTLKLHQLSKNLGHLHTALKNLTIQYYLDMKAICHEDQKTKLFQTFKMMVNSNGDLTMPEEKHYKNN